MSCAHESAIWIFQRTAVHVDQLDWLSQVRNVCDNKETPMLRPVELPFAFPCGGIENHDIITQ
jgi:hypothetical protein